MADAKNVVYVLRNRVNGLRYVGKTVRGFARRWRQHKSAARLGEKGHLYNSIRKYDPEAFEREDLFALDDVCKGKSPEQINDVLSLVEIDLIERLETYDPAKGYNGTFGGDGAIPTDETLEAISKPSVRRS